MTSPSTWYCSALAVDSSSLPLNVTGTSGCTCSDTSSRSTSSLADLTAKLSRRTSPRVRTRPSFNPPCTSWMITRDSEKSARPDSARTERSCPRTWKRVSVSEARPASDGAATVPAKAAVKSSRPCVRSTRLVKLESRRRSTEPRVFRSTLVGPQVPSAVNSVVGPFISSESTSMAPAL